jgi:CBS-domain-containing membrane protein
VTFGLLTNFVLGAGYISGAVAMVITIGCMIVLDVVHPPAVSTALSFAFQADIENNLVLFSLAVGAVALLVSLERFVLWILAR